jgi:hypothetical protein
MENQDNEKTTLENVEQYEGWKKELDDLQHIDFSDDWEYIGARIEALQADISAYVQSHAIIAASGANPEMDYGTYWNTIGVENDRQNGDM